MSRLRLSLACGDYDRTRALEEGTVRADGIDLVCLRLPVEETFFRMARHREFDVAEMSLSTYVATLSGRPPPFVAIPVFTSRMFRHSAVYVNTAAGIDRPADLRGKLVGTPEYQLTACVWVRGILADFHDVPVGSVAYRTGGQEAPGRIEKADVCLGGVAAVAAVPPDRTLSQMLASGEIQALHTPRVPAPFAAGDPRVARLWPDPAAQERAYFARTGIFPIMHVVAIRREIYQAHRWIAQSLYKAFCLAKARAEAELYDSSALRVMSPWLIQDLERARALLGPDYWSYGLGEANRKVLATFLRYHREQGLSDRVLSPDDLFAPESLESAVI